MSGAPTTGRFCWSCGASLIPSAEVRTVTRCAICAELTHIQYLFNQLDEWRREGVVDDGLAAELRARYEARRDELLTPSSQEREAGTAVEPEPSAEPVAPGEWERFREAAGVSWIYAVGVLFVVAGLGWLVAEFGGQAWGRMLLAGIVGLLSATSLRAGWWLLQVLELRVGGQALLAIGALLVPATLFALGNALGLPDEPAVGAAIWIAGAAVAFVIAAAARLASQLGLGNLCAFLAVVELADALAARGGLEWYGIFLAPLALLNVWLSARVAGASEAEETAEMGLAARWSAGLMTALATLALLTTVGDWWPQPASAAIGTAALLSAALGAMAWEADRPLLLALAAAAWILFGYLLDLGGLGAAGGLVGVGGLVAAADRVRERREHFTLWLAVASLVAALPLVGPSLGDLLAGRSSAASAGSAWAVAAVYAVAGMAWRSRRMLWAAVGVASLAVPLTVGWLGLPARWQPLALAALAAAVVGASQPLRGSAWPGGSAARALALAALAPVVAGLLWLAWLAAGPPEPLVVVDAVGLALAGAAVALLAPEPWAWLPAGAAGLLAAHIAAGLTPLDPGVAAGLVANCYLAAALRRGAGLRPLELLSTAALVALALARLDWWDGEPHAASGWVFGLAALGLLAPTWPGLASRSTVPELTRSGLRAWLGVFAAAAAGAVASSRWELGLGLGAALVAATAALAGRSCGWPDAAVAVAAVTGFGELWSRPSYADLAVLLLCQVALLAPCGQRCWTPVLAVAQWLLVAAAWELQAEVSLATRWLSYGLIHAAVGTLHLTRLAQSAEAGVSGLLILAAAHGYLGWGFAPGHLALWYGLYTLLTVTLAWQWRVMGHGRAADGALALAAVSIVASVTGAMLADRVNDALLLLLLDTALAAVLSRAGTLRLSVPVALANLTAAYGLYHLRGPLPAGSYGVRLAALCFANVAIAAALRRRPSVVEQVLPLAAVVGVGSFAVLMPPARPTVTGLVLLAASSFTAAWLTRRALLNDLGFFCAWLAAAIVMIDAAQHGREELYPYRSFDLYAVPVGLYLLGVVERRSAESAQVRWAAALMILGSLLVSAFAATSPGHDAALFVAVMAAVVYGIQRRDAVLRYAGVVTFVAWILIQVWRLRTGLGQGLLIALLLVLGAGAIAAGLRQEGRSRRAEEEATTAP